MITLCEITVVVFLPVVALGLLIFLIANLMANN